MLFTELLKMAALSLIANKLRTFLTMLGIIIGVCSVIAMVSVGQGVKKNVVDSISRLGAEVLIAAVFVAEQVQFKLLLMTTHWLLNRK